jgi:ribose transport system ATP-binding protein
MDDDARLKVLEAYEQIRRLAADYAHGVDKRDRERFAAVWHDDASWLPMPDGDWLEGRDAIVGSLDGIWSGVNETHHWVSNHSICVDGDAATGLADVSVVMQTPDGAWTRLAATYDDVYEQRDGRWIPCPADRRAASNVVTDPSALSDSIGADPSGSIAEPPALSVRHVSKTFGAQRALDDVALDVGRGEIHALVGANGSGKSTLVKIVAGYHEPDPGAGGEVLGQPFALGSGAAARAAGLRFVHQNLGLVERMSVADNFRLEGGRGGLRPIARKAERADATTALNRLGYDIAPTRMVAELVESERTAVAVARALDHVELVRLLVLDEPTASLPGPEVDRLFTAIRRVAAAGTAILFISHHLDEVLGLADAVTVLRDGRRVATTHVGELSHDSLVELMLGRQLMKATALHERLLESDAAPRSSRLVVSKVFGTSVERIDLEVRPGEVLGIAGLTGSGREEIAGLITGRLARGGEVRVDGHEVPPGDPRAAVERGLCYVPADRAAQALLRVANVRENLTLPKLGPPLLGLLARRPEKRDAQRWVGELDVRPPETEKTVSELSGGNQQKVVMARWLRVEPAVLVLDEPTQGVDVGSKADIHALVERAAAAGSAVVMCSTDADELARLATEVVIMRRGRIGVRLTGHDINTEQIEQEQLLAAEPVTPAHLET